MSPTLNEWITNKKMCIFFLLFQANQDQAEMEASYQALINSSFNDCSVSRSDKATVWECGGRMFDSLHAVTILRFLKLLGKNFLPLSYQLLDLLLPRAEHVEMVTLSLATNVQA